MRHAWAGYRAHAWGRDELKPISAHGQDNWGGMGVTLVDSLDTLWIMGMKDEFNEAKEWVRCVYARVITMFDTLFFPIRSRPRCPSPEPVVCLSLKRLFVS